MGLTFNSDGSYSFDASSYDYLHGGRGAGADGGVHGQRALSTSAPANLVITVTGTNDVPVANAAVAAVAEDASITGNVTATDADAGEAATLTYALVNPLAAPAGLTFNSDGSYSFDASSYDYLTAGEELELTVAFTASDALSTSAPANLVITVTGTNDVPVANAAVAAVAEDASITGNVTATDADAGEAATLTYALVNPLAAPVGLTFNSDGSYSFDASSYDYLTAGEELELTVAFTASDALSTSAPANLVITVTGTNDVPVANAAVAAVAEDASITGNVTATDADAGEAATLTYALVNPLAAPVGLTFNSDGSYSFDASSYDYLTAGEELELTVAFTASDALSTSAPANLVITVTGTNDVPVANAAVAAVAEDASITGNVTATDADAGEAATLTYALVNPLAAPVGLTFNSDGSYSFDASSYDYLTAGEELELTVAFTASDALSTSAPANLVITVTGTNDVPVANAAVAAVAEDASITGNVTATDADAGEAATLTYALVNPLAAPVGLTFNSDGSYSFDASSYDYLTAGEELELTVAFTASDALSTSAPANLVITVTGTNDVPVANAAVAAVAEDASITGNVTATDADAGEAATLTYALVNPLAAPVGLTFNSDGSYSFDASSYDYLTAGEELELTVAFTASDALSTSAPANLVITVTGTNDVPVANAAVAAVAEDASITGNVTATDADAGEAATLTYALVNPLAAPVGLTFNSDGSYSFDASSYDYLTAGEELELTVAFTASDALSTSAPANLVITVTGTNDVPVANAAVAAVAEDASITGNVTATDADAGEAATLTYALVNPLAAPVGLTFNSDGSYSFDASSYDYLTAGEELELTVAFTASDALSTSAPANLVITVTGTNDVPVANAVVAAVAEDASITGNVTATDADAGEAATLTYALVNPLAAPVGLTFNSDGSYSFDASSYDYLTAGEELELTVAFTASDALSTSAPANLVITVTGTNDAPTDIQFQATVPTSENAAPTTIATLSTSDPDAGAIVTYSVQNQTVLSGAAEVFAISSITGNTIVVADGVLVLDNTIDRYSLTIRATDEFNAHIDETIFLTLGTNFNNGDQTPAITGDSGDDIIYTLSSGNGTNQRDVVNAGSGNDQVFGQGGKDTLRGQVGADVLSGGGGTDILIGGEGIDVLTGGADSDVFRFESGDLGSVDTITDFSSATIGAGGDVLDISDLLVGAPSLNSGNVSSYLQIQVSGGNSIVSIDRDGTGSSHGFQDLVLLQGVTGLNLTTLLSNGNIDWTP